MTVGSLLGPGSLALTAGSAEGPARAKRGAGPSADPAERLRGALQPLGVAVEPEALTRLAMTVDLDGIAVLVAESGCGKSLLLGLMADELVRDGWVAHYFAHSTVARRCVDTWCRSHYSQSPST